MLERRQLAKAAKVIVCVCVCVHACVNIKIIHFDQNTLIEHTPNKQYTTFP